MFTTGVLCTVYGAQVYLISSSNIIVCWSLSFQHLSILFLWILTLEVDISSNLYILALINSINKITIVNNNKITIQSNLLLY